MRKNVPKRSQQVGFFTRPLERLRSSVVVSVQGPQPSAQGHFSTKLEVITLYAARAASFSQYPVASQMGCHVRTFGRRLTKRGRWSRT